MLTSRKTRKKRKSGLAAENLRIATRSIFWERSTLISYRQNAPLHIARTPKRVKNEQRLNEADLRTDLGRLSDLLPYHFPFACLVLFDRRQKGRALCSRISKRHRICGTLLGKPHPLQSRHNAYPMLVISLCALFFIQGRSHLVPMLFHTSFGSIWKSLLIHVRLVTVHFAVCSNSSTFAISPQLLCESLIVFSRCSSAGVHGVFVLLFFGALSDDIGSPMASMWSIWSPKPPGSPIPVEGRDSPPIDCMLGALRFREVGEMGSGWGASNISSG